jgi:hypothetical protein
MMLAAIDAVPEPVMSSVFFVIGAIALKRRRR